MSDRPSIRNPRRALGAVFAIVVVDMVGFGILLPIIPLYAANFGANEFVVGLLLASYSVTQFVSAPILGRLSDERGRRFILLVSLLGSTIAWTLFGLAESLAVLFVARIIAGAMGGNIATTQAYVADITTEENRAKGMGLMGAAYAVGLALGPALGGLFSGETALALARATLPAFVPISEFSLPSFVAAAITAVNFVVAFVVLPETRHGGSSSRDDRSRLTRLRDALSNPALKGLIVSFFLFALAFAGMESMLVLFTQDSYGYGPEMNGYILAYAAVVAVFAQGVLVGPLTDRFGERRLAIAGAALQLFTLAALPFAPILGEPLPNVGPLADELIALLAIPTVLVAGHGFTNASLNTLVSKNAPVDAQGGTFGITQSAGSIARSVGPVIAGALYTAAYWGPFVMGGLLMVPILYVLSTAVRSSMEPAPA